MAFLTPFVAAAALALTAPVGRAQDLPPQEPAARPATVCLTNACGVLAAVKAGDVSKVMDLGGTPADLLKALRAQAEANPDLLFQPTALRPITMKAFLDRVDEQIANGDVPTFIVSGGRSRFAMFGPDGRFKSSTTIEGMNVPGRAPVGIPFEIPAPQPPPPFGQLPAPPPPPAYLPRPAG